MIYLCRLENSCLFADNFLQQKKWMKDRSCGLLKESLSLSCFRLSTCLSYQTATSHLHQMSRNRWSINITCPTSKKERTWEIWTFFLQTFQYRQMFECIVVVRVWKLLYSVFTKKWLHHLSEATHPKNAHYIWSKHNRYQILNVWKINVTSVPSMIGQVL